MFDTLSQVIKHDDAVEISLKERILDGVVIAALSVALFGGLYLAVLPSPSCPAPSWRRWTYIAGNLSATVDEATFRIMGFLFLAIVPLVLLMRRARQSAM